MPFNYRFRMAPLVALILTSLALLVYAPPLNSERVAGPLGSFLTASSQSHASPGRGAPDQAVHLGQDAQKDGPKSLIVDSKAQQPAPREGWMRLRGEVPTVVARATPLPDKIAGDSTLTLTIILKHSNQTGFDRY